jgi:hypothetical protein
VLLGGISNIGDASWLAAVFATPGFDAAHKFDVANVHLRTTLDGIAGALLAWHKFFQFVRDGAVPLWVTETGYPSNPYYQYDPAFKGYDQTSGEDQQAAFLAKALPAMLFAGAGKVFVTERDNLTGQYASEGLIGGVVSDVDSDAVLPSPVLKPSYHVFVLLNAAAASSPAAAPPASEPPTGLKPRARPRGGNPAARHPAARHRVGWATAGPDRPRRPAR